MPVGAERMKDSNNTTTEHCLFYNIEVTLVDGKCTEDCSMEDCALVDYEDSGETDVDDEK